ncbi:MAG: hypothetical protein H8K10_14315 [Nitrospira sp.]|nr:hypothetical protein [Nitrospira sp.]
MPVTTVSLTTDEYQAIMDRLKGLESLQATRATDLAPVLQRIQGSESTVSALVSTVASMPKLEARITALEKVVGAGGTKTL